MSDLKIGYSNFMIRANIFEREPDTLGSEDLFLGSRVETYLAPDGENTVLFEVDVGIGNEFAADFVAFTRMDKSSPRSSIALTIVGAADETFTPNEFFGSGVSALQGPNAEDFVLFANPGGGAGQEITTDYRFYRVDCSLLNNETLELSNIYFGEAFDFGTNPLAPARNTFEVYGKGSRVTEREFRFEWKGITQEIKNDFERNVYKDRDIAPVLLLDPTGCILDNETIITCQMSDARFDMKDGDRFDIAVTFTELT